MLTFRWGNHHTFKSEYSIRMVLSLCFRSGFAGKRLFYWNIWFHTHNKIINIDGIRNELFWRIVRRSHWGHYKNSLFTCRFFFRIHFLTLSHQAIFNLLIVILVRWCETKHFKTCHQTTLRSSIHTRYSDICQQNSRCKWSLLDVVNGNDVIEKLVEMISTPFFLLLHLCAWVDIARRAKCSTYHNYRSSIHFFSGNTCFLSSFTVNLGHFDLILVFNW